MKTRYLLAALLLVCVVGVLSSCGKKEDPMAAAVKAGPPPAATTATATPATGDVPKGSGQTIGVSLLTKTHVFYQDMEAAMQAEATKLGFKLNVMSAEFDANTQNSQVDNFIVQKVAAIILCPADSASVGGAVKKANAAGIPVFTADISAKEGDIVCHIASDNRHGGELAAELIAKAVNSKGKVLVIDHPAVESVQARTAGFDEVMKKYPEIKVIKQPAEGQRAKAREVTENMLSANPDLKGIFGINDDSALGALAACRAHKGADKIVIIGFDGTPEARKEIAAGGQLLADVVQHPKDIATTTIDTIARFLAKQQVPKAIPVQVDVLDKAAIQKEAGK